MCLRTLLFKKQNINKFLFFKFFIHSDLACQYSTHVFFKSEILHWKLFQIGVERNNWFVCICFYFLSCQIRFLFHVQNLKLPLVRIPALSSCWKGHMNCVAWCISELLGVQLLQGQCCVSITEPATQRKPKICSSCFHGESTLPTRKSTQAVNWHTSKGISATGIHRDPGELLSVPMIWCLEYLLVVLFTLHNTCLKTVPFCRFHEQTGLAYSSFLFFDDEYRNIQDLSQIGTFIGWSPCYCIVIAWEVSKAMFCTD